MCQAAQLRGKPIPSYSARSVPQVSPGPGARPTLPEALKAAILAIVKARG